VPSIARLTCRDDAPWAHLKVMTVDSAAAYIGSANVTGATLAGPNLELLVVTEVTLLPIGTIPLPCVPSNRVFDPWANPL